MGSRTLKLVSPGVESTRISPPCPLTMRRTMSSPSPVPSPTPLVVKNGSKMRLFICRGIPGPSSVISSVAGGLYLQLTGPIHGVYSVVHEVGPHLVQFSTVRADLRQPFGVLALDRHTFLELVGEDGKRALQPLAHVHLTRGCLVHVRVLLHRPHKLRDPASALPDLVCERRQDERRAEPPQRSCERFVVEALRPLGQSVQAFGVESRRNQRRRELKGILDAVILQPVGQFVFPVALLQRVERDGCAGALR